MKSGLEKQAAVEAIASALTRLEPGEILPYAQIANVMMNDRNILARAKKQVEESHGYIFGTVYKEGVKRLSARKMIIDAAFASTQRLMNRTEKRTVSALIHDKSMTRQEKVELNSGIASINAIQLAVKIAKG